MKDLFLNMQLFAEGEAAAAAPAGGAEGAGTAAGTDTGDAPISAGEQLATGEKVSPQVAAAMNRQMKRHPELRKVYTRGSQAQQPAAVQPIQQGAQQQPAGNDAESRWEELKRGEFKDLYARDIQEKIRDRFKNQEDLQGRLDGMQPMLEALMKKTGAESVEELQAMVLDDDSLYEDEAEEMGMPVEAYKNFKRLQEEHDAAIAREQRSQEEMFFRDHIEKLVRQGEELKQQFPNFDFRTEMENETFRRLTSPEVGISVADAYFAIHRNELTPQLMSYGMQRAQKQMGQTLQAQQARPAEGAMRAQNQAAADVRLNPATMSRKEREEIKRQVRLGKRVSFD